MEYDQDGTPTQPRGEDAQESAPKEEKAALPLLKKQISVKSATLSQDELVSPLPAKLKVENEDAVSEPDLEEVEDKPDEAPVVAETASVKTD